MIRPAIPGDLAEVVALCAEHAAYERAAMILDGQTTRLEQALFGSPPLLWCLVACLEGTVVGYATYTRDYSTWRAAAFVYMDCLFVTARHRGSGLGRELVAAIAEQARRAGCASIEWQTPDWNLDAARFYDRLGATQYPKLRYHWKLS